MQINQSSRSGFWKAFRSLGFALWIPLPLGLFACEAVKVRVESNPPEALIHIDGIPMARAPYQFPAPYYGAIDVYASLPPEGAKSYLPQHVLVPIPLPAPRLFFPFDLGLEGIQRLLGIQPKPLIQLKLKQVVIPSSKVGKPDEEGREEDSLIQRAEKDALRR
jgi:hypothetical protein